MKKLLLGIFTIATMASCMQEQVVNAPVGTAIGFDNFVQYTKADPSFNNGSNKLTSFYVWGFMYDLAAAPEPANVVFNQQLVEWSDAAGKYTYSPIQYWFTEKNYKFAALAPVELLDNGQAQLTLANGDYMSADGVLGTVTFTNIDGDKDLVYAQATETTDTTIPDGKSAHLQFHHLLSKIKFTFVNKLPESNYSLSISDVQLVVPAEGVTNLADVPADGSALFAWTANTAANAPTTVLKFGDVVDTYDNDEKLASAGGVGVVEDERLTIPFTVPNSQLEHKVTFKITLHSSTNTVTQTYEKEAVLIVGDLKAGKCYNYTAEIMEADLGLKPIEFTVEVDEWVNGNNYDFTIGQ